MSYNNKTVSAIILARGGSKGIPNKNIQLVGGRSFLQRCVEVAKVSQFIDNCFVSTDDEFIFNYTKSLGAHPIMRPADLATDTASSADAIADALMQILLHKLSPTPDIVVELMCTNPFKTTEDVDKCIEKLHITGADSVVGVSRVLDHHPARLKYIEHDILVNFFPETKESRRQDLVPYAYVRNGSIYAFTYDSFINYGSRYGGVVRPYIMEGQKTINIDEPIDLIVANEMAKLYDI